MDLIAKKSETSLRRRNSFSTASDASSSVVKRRRRCPSMLALNDQKTVAGDDQNQLQTSTTPIIDQSGNVVTATTPTTPTTVKRSSKFRGVSRCRKFTNVFLKTMIELTIFLCQYLGILLLLGVTILDTIRNLTHK